CLLGVMAWWQTSQVGFLIGAVAIIAPWPWTLIGIKPTNDALLATEVDGRGRRRGRWWSNGARCMASAPYWARWQPLLFCGHACRDRFGVRVSRISPLPM